MMIRAPHVDDTFEATLKLVQMIGNIGSEISELSVFTL